MITFQTCSWVLESFLICEMGQEAYLARKKIYTHLKRTEKEMF